MKAIIAATAAAALLVGAAGSACADPHPNGYNNGNHQDGEQQRADQQHAGWGKDYGGASHKWRRGQKMGYNDWSGAAPVDYRQHHLRQPPNGYEWRESNGQYVLAAVATGVIASIIYNSTR